jgi:hypothetical protein
MGTVLGKTAEACHSSGSSVLFSSSSLKPSRPVVIILFLVSFRLQVAPSIPPFMSGFIILIASFIVLINRTKRYPAMYRAMMDKRDYLYREDNNPCTDP